MAEGGGEARGGPEAPPTTLRMLSAAWERLGSAPGGRRALRLLGVRSIGRAWLRAAVIPEVAGMPDDVTVLVGVRDRSDHRIVNALRSIRDQRYPPGDVTSLVIDYGSGADEARRLSEVCSRFGAQLLRVEGTPMWSRSRCLNIGLRRVRTKYVMTSDADVVLSPHYLADAVATLRAHPLSVVCSAMLDLPEDSVEATRRADADEVPFDPLAWRSRCRPRLGWELHPSIAVTFTAFHHAIRGYDEFYSGWGREDDDLMRRFTALGLRATAVADRSFYLHQWHPKFEGIPDEERAGILERNTDHFVRTRSILRNHSDWGRAAVSA